MRKVIWSPRARGALLNVISYISQDDARSADLVKQRIDDAGNRLGAAATGRPARIVGLYEKSVARTSYIILHALPDQQSVLILDVVHASRNWPTGAWPPR